MSPRRRLVAAFAAVLLALVVAAPRASADDGDGGKKESRSVWDRVTGAVDDVTDWALPGDSIADKAWAIPTGKSPFSPPVNLGNIDNVYKGERWVAEQAGRALIPGYGAALDFRDNVTDAVNENVPGGMRTVGIAGLVLILWLLWRILMPPAVQASKAAVVKYVPGAGAVVKSRPAPAQRQSRHSSSTPPSSSTRPKWTHSGRPGKADVVSATSGRLIVCADGEDQAMAAARRRWQGHRLRTTGIDRCDLGPDKVHVNVAKVKR